LKTCQALRKLLQLDAADVETRWEVRSTLAQLGGQNRNVIMSGGVHVFVTPTAAIHMISFFSYCCIPVRTRYIQYHKVLDHAIVLLSYRKWDSLIMKS
jgi:hypothetical protein